MPCLSIRCRNPKQGTPSPIAIPFALAIQIRTPVNEPGPRPHTTQAIWLRATFSRFKSESISGRSFTFEARKASVSHDATISIARTSRSSFPSQSRSFRLRYQSKYKIFHAKSFIWFHFCFHAIPLCRITNHVRLSIDRCTATYV